MAAIYSIAYIDKAKQLIMKGKDKDEIIHEIANELIPNLDKDTAILTAKLAYARALINIYQEHNTIPNEESEYSDRGAARSNTNTEHTKAR